ncbi:recombinase family protein [Aeromonas caviae]|uniref:recombinase family protein n=1 Tax=Aeromonas caviae TaxID=648 RepID=UPI001F2E22A8|nr:recombinase family protein [Aeromonas caviae]
MIEVFERHGVSFVSVTQQFNTTNSMGRLMLNILLSFAQFEREVTGERIRDKITASKKKGLNELDFPCVRRQNHISVIRICSCSNPGVRPLLN